MNLFSNSTHQSLLIAGPCSAETADQLHQTANELMLHTKPNLLRAGVWKPRTRPGEFEGVGIPALGWLKEAGLKHGVPVCTEVANAQHVEAALKAGIDVLWIGARTTVNPFSVQEIADALQGVKIPIMIKNPVNPDIALWLGAMERLNRAGIEQLAGIHRGFTHYGRSSFRNEPMWDIAIRFKQELPQTPLICDPSHIAGKRDLLALVAQRALDLDYQGLMIESHVNPDQAWTDAKQQVTPENLAGILGSLVSRKPTADSPSLLQALDTLRSQIDQIDEKIMHAMAERMQVVAQIGSYKRQHGVTILQVNRWDEMVKKRSHMGDALGLYPGFTRKMLEIIHAESIRRQNEVMNPSYAISNHQPVHKSA